MQADIRFVVDESSFDFRQNEDAEIEAALDQLADLLQLLKADGITVGIFSEYEYVECRANQWLLSFLYERTSHVSQDTLTRLARLLDSCARWDDELAEVVDPNVTIGEFSLVAFSVGWAIARRTVAPCGVLTCSTTARRGLLNVTTGDQGYLLYFVQSVGDLSGFWRYFLEILECDEAEFFALAKRAFPRLVFRPDLTFRDFACSYSVAYPWVVKVLSVLDEFFATSVTNHKGDRVRIQQDLSARGVDASPESPGTHKNARAMKQRTVAFDGVGYVCEWHAKREWNVDRIHFTTPQDGLQGRILIGIFTEHLAV